jgi:hypothetical protein
MEKQKRTVLKAREKQAIDCFSEIFWSFYSMLHALFKFKQPNNILNKFWSDPNLTDIEIIHNLTKIKAWYTFNQKFCFNFQPGTLRIIHFHQ